MGRNAPRTEAWGLCPGAVGYHQRFARPFAGRIWRWLATTRPA